MRFRVNTQDVLWFQNKSVSLSSEKEAELFARQINEQGYRSKFNAEKPNTIDIGLPVVKKANIDLAKEERKLAKVIKASLPG